MLEFAWCVEWVDIDHRAARAQGSGHRNRKLQYVGHHEGDSMALAKTLRLQPGRERQRRLIKLFEGHDSIHAPIGRSLGIASKCLVQHGHH